MLRSRIDAARQVIVNLDDRPIKDIIHVSSSDADIVFVGLREPSPEGEAELLKRLADLIGDLPGVVMVRAAGPFAGRLLETPESEAEPVIGSGDTLASPDGSEAE